MDPVNNTFNASLYGQQMGGEIISQTLSSLNQYGPAPGAAKKTNQYGATSDSGNGTDQYGATGSNTSQYGTTGANFTMAASKAMSYDYNFQQSFLSNAYPESGVGALVSSKT